VKIPHSVRIAGLVFATTAFYGYVGQLVPQREVQPPQETVLRTDMTTADMVKVGGELMASKGLCLTCHTIGKTGALRFPDLAGVATRATTRIPGLNEIEYFAKSMYEPDSFIVPGFNPGMPTINKPPIGLTDQEILCVIAFLQTLGGTPTVTLQTSHHYYTAPGAAPAAPGAPGAPTNATPTNATPTNTTPTNTTPAVTAPPKVTR